MKEFIRSLAFAVCKALSPKQVGLLPTGKKVATYTELYDFLVKKFPNVPLYLSDTDYKLAHYDDVAQFLAEDTTNRFGYSKDYDCDDFAYRLLGQFSVPGWAELTFGMVWTDTHALNVVITEDWQFFFVEPQNDELLTELKAGTGTTIRFIII